MENVPNMLNDLTKGTREKLLPWLPSTQVK